MGLIERDISVKTLVPKRPLYKHGPAGSLPHAAISISHLTLVDSSLFRPPLCPSADFDQRFGFVGISKFFLSAFSFRFVFGSMTLMVDLSCILSGWGLWRLYLLVSFVVTGICLPCRPSWYITTHIPSPLLSHNHHFTSTHRDFILFVLHVFFQICYVSWLMIKLKNRQPYVWILLCGKA